MVTAIVLMNIERGKVPAVSSSLLEIPAVTEVYSVAGAYDLVAIIRVKHHDQLNDLVTERLSAVEGIRATMTLVAFRCFSRKDVQAMWDIGLD
ncbi:MAG TPA: Lrp/AsnC ligand binding domain-containing protein [Candidatus Tumulicola sp.]|nr:Lrp/AsnC ligand binding domain-containing protein [Candidatus Tumulicola sp.]